MTWQYLSESSLPMESTALRHEAGAADMLDSADKCPFSVACCIRGVGLSEAALSCQLAGETPLLNELHRSECVAGCGKWGHLC